MPHRLVVQLFCGRYKMHINGTRTGQENVSLAVSFAPESCGVFPEKISSAQHLCPALCVSAPVGLQLWQGLGEAVAICYSSLDTFNPLRLCELTF